MTSAVNPRQISVLPFSQQQPAPELDPAFQIKQIGALYIRFMSDDALNEALAQLKLKVIVLLPLAVIGIGLASLVINKVTLITFVVFQILIPAYNQMREGYQLWQASKIDIAEEVTQFQAAEHSWEEIQASMPGHGKASHLHPLIPIPLYQKYTPEKLREMLRADLEAMQTNGDLPHELIFDVFDNASLALGGPLGIEEAWKQLHAHFHNQIVPPNALAVFRQNLTDKWNQINGSTLDIDEKVKLFELYEQLAAFEPRSDAIIWSLIQTRAGRSGGFESFAAEMMRAHLHLLEHGVLPDPLPTIALGYVYGEVMNDYNKAFKRFMDTPLSVPAAATLNAV
jgi:hypothetical protein